MSPDKNETCIEFVNRVWGECSLEEADILLWNCTAFPCADISHIEKQLKDIKERSGGNVGKAVHICDEEMEIALKEIAQSKTSVTPSKKDESRPR
jgi:hypothetical protein